AQGFGRKGKFLLSGLSVFGINEAVEFFEKRGLKTKIERGSRIFPQTDKAQDVLGVLIAYLKQDKAEIRTRTKITGFEKTDGRVTKLLVEGGKNIIANKYILCTGGKSYPRTGSTGDGFKWVRELGHSVEKLRPALVPLKIKEAWPKEAQGLSLKNVEITVFQGNKKQDSRFGEALFTHFGLSGPIILDMSKSIGELLEKGGVKLVLDLKPALDFSKLDKRVQRDFKKYQKKEFKNSLSDLLPQKLIPVIIELSGIDPQKQICNV
ncbi:unnamed protein product, partial [marine sediment metagenome]